VRNFVFSLLEHQPQYSFASHIFNIQPSRPGKEPRLYLTSKTKFIHDKSIFESPDYHNFLIEDIHVTVLPSHESKTMAPRKSKLKNSNPFHITIRLRTPDSEDLIVIHDFYSALDNSRDIHIQLHHNDSITYLPPDIIHQNNFDHIIEKEIQLVQALIEINQSHEQKLLNSIEQTTKTLYSLATQAINFPEIMGPEDYEQFLSLLRKNVYELEELMTLGHAHESRRLQNMRLELAHWSEINHDKSNAVAASVEEPAPLSQKQKTKNQSKSKASTKPKISKGVLNQYQKSLEEYFSKTQKLNDLIDQFLKHTNEILNPTDSFKPGVFIEHCRAHQPLFEELSFEVSENIVLKFFGQFSICQEREKQYICRDIALFLSEHLPHYSKHMHQLSLINYNFMGHRISPILMAFLSNNPIFWEYMHNYGMSFSDNRHIIYDGISGNLLHGMIILLRVDPIKFVAHLNEFVERLFQYLKEDGRTLSNMRMIVKLVTPERKKISANSFFGKSRLSDTPEVERFKACIFEEPYGTLVIMDAIELWLVRARNNFCLNIRPSEKELTLMPKLVELMTILGRHVDTKVLLRAFERLLALQPLGMFDDYSCHKLLSKAPESPLALLSHFELVYVGEEFKEPINNLLFFFILSLNQHAKSMSKTMLTTLMQSYFDASLAQQTHNPTPFKAIGGGGIDWNDAQIKSILITNQKLTLARIGYLLFCIKVQRKLNLVLADYQVMLNFYQCYLATELSRFTKDEPEYKHQRKVCLNLMASAARAIEQLTVDEELKTQISESNEYRALMATYRMLEDEQDEKSCKIGGI